MKKLHRSRTDKVLAGLLGGIGEYFNLDPVWIRFVFIIVLIFSEIWPAVVVYIIGYIMVPQAPDFEVVSSTEEKHEEHI